MDSSWHWVAWITEASSCWSLIACIQIFGKTFWVSFNFSLQIFSWRFWLSWMSYLTIHIICASTIRCMQKTWFITIIHTFKSLVVVLILFLKDEFIRTAKEKSPFNRCCITFSFIVKQASGWEWEEPPEVHQILHRGSWTNVGWIFWGEECEWTQAVDACMVQIGLFWWYPFSLVECLSRYNWGGLFVPSCWVGGLNLDAISNTE